MASSPIDNPAGCRPSHRMKVSSPPDIRTAEPLMTFLLGCCLPSVRIGHSNATWPRTSSRLCWLSPLDFGLPGVVGIALLTEDERTETVNNLHGAGGRLVAFWASPGVESHVIVPVVGAV